MPGEQPLDVQVAYTEPIAVRSAGDGTYGVAFMGMIFMTEGQFAAYKAGRRLAPLQVQFEEED